MKIRGGLLASLVLASLTMLAPTPPAFAANPAPFVTATPTRVVPGQTIRVRGFWFNPGESVSVQVCGDGGLIGAQGCGLRTQAALITEYNGGFSTTLRVHTPPYPCPCVVQVYGVDSGAFQVPITIRGVRTSSLQPPAKALRPAVTITNIHVSVHDGWRSWLGLPTTGSVSYTITSSGTAPLDQTPVVLNVRSWPNGTNTVPADNAGPLVIGRSRSYQVPIHIGAVTVGDVDAHGVVQLPLRGTTFGASTFTLPWGLLAVVVLLGILSFRRFFRRRSAKHDGSAEGTNATTEPALTPSTAEGPVDTDLDTLLMQASGVDDRPEGAAEGI
jgi:hypothetical protein